jgi:DNA-directed RNA polymerase subunit RPC12/RpoP
MAIKFACGACGKKLMTEEMYAGQRSKCPACGQRIGAPQRTAWETTDLPDLVPRPLTRVNTGGPSSLDDSESAEPDPPADGEKRRPFWKDPVVVIGLAVPALILTFFFSYLFWPYVHVHAKQLVIVGAVVPTLVLAVFSGCSLWPHIQEYGKLSWPVTLLRSSIQKCPQQRSAVSFRSMRLAKPRPAWVIRYVGPRGGIYHYSRSGKKVYEPKRRWGR